jgi:hypothetical protein
LWANTEPEALRGGAMTDVTQRTDQAKRWRIAEVS